MVAAQNASLTGGADRNFNIGDDKSRAFLLEILANIAHGIVVVDKNGVIDAVNSAYYSAFGVDDTVMGQDFEAVVALVAPRFGWGEGDCVQFCERTRLGERFAQEIPVDGLDGSKGWMHVLYNPMPSGGFVLTLTDISQLKNLEDQLRHQATHDALTKLPNRSLFQDRAKLELAHAKRDGTSGAIVFVDLDNFKDVNDRHGHEIGDALLVAAAERLVAEVREYDTVARLGGDEFTILLPEVESDASLENLLGRMLRALSRPFHLNGFCLSVSASLGASRYPRDGLDIGTLSHKADAAMYAAKREGKARWRFYEPAMPFGEMQS